MMLNDIFKKDIKRMLKTKRLLRAIYDEAIHMVESEKEAESIAAYMLARWNQGSLKSYYGVQDWAWINKIKSKSKVCLENKEGTCPVCLARDKIKTGKLVFEDRNQFRLHNCVLDIYTSPGWLKYKCIASEAYVKWIH